MTLALATFAFALASALIPVVNIELYLGVLATQADPARAVGLALIGALGTTLGKLAWYLGAARLTQSRMVQRKLADPRRRARYDRWHDRLRSRPFLAAAVLLLSSVVGLPPLLVLSVVAGSLRMPLVWFVPTVFLGRAVRFYLILVGVELALA